MILETGDKILASLRRNFDQEYARFFLGQIDAASDTSILVNGHLWVWDAYSQNVVRREGQRRKLIPLTAGQFVVHLLDREEDVDALTFHTDGNGKIWLVRGETPYLELAERAASRQ